MFTEIASGVLNAPASSGGGLAGMLLPMIILIAVFYFLMIRPENKKKKENQKMRAELAVGDPITTIGGIVGTICAVKEDTVVVETSADRVRVEFAKWAIANKSKQVLDEAVGEVISENAAPKNSKDNKDTQDSAK